MSEHLHSSAQPRGTYLAKTVMGRTRADEKQAKDAADAKAERACYRKVDQRDGLRCRVTGKQLSLQGSMVVKVQRHHIIARSQGGPHATWNVVTVSKAVHDEIHVKGCLWLFGNADLRDDHGRLCGVKVVRLVNDVRTIVGMV